MSRRHSQTFHSLLACLCISALASVATVHAAESPEQSFTDPDYKVQGEFAGDITTTEGSIPIGVQVIALGHGKFRAVGYKGGLPGAGWNGGDKHQAEGESKNGSVEFTGDHFTGKLTDGVLSIYATAGINVGDLKKIERKSPTLGAKSPAGAVVLFDGSNADQFDGGRMTAEGLLMQGCTSKPKFQSGLLHLEFRLPFMPEATGQDRGNSGCYLQGRYEVQVLDSFGLEGRDNECGGIYSIQAPKVNMCLPPGAWQTYDIEFTAAKYEGEKKVTDATATVKHNGEIILKDVKLDHATAAAPQGESPQPGPVFLQDHNNQVRFRNVWFVEKN